MWYATLMSDELYALILDILRLVGRVAFILFMVAGWRLWRQITTPTVRKRARTGMFIFVGASIIGLIFALIDYFFLPGGLRLISALIGTGVTVILAWLMNREASLIENTAQSVEYKEYSEALDKLISTLKRE